MKCFNCEKQKEVPWHLVCIDCWRSLPTKLQEDLIESHQICAQDPKGCLKPDLSQEANHDSWHTYCIKEVMDYLRSKQ